MLMEFLESKMFASIITLVFVAFMITCIAEMIRDYKEMKERFAKKDREESERKQGDKFSDYR